MALIYKVTTEERVTLSVNGEAFRYWLWMRGETPGYTDDQRCVQLQTFLFSMGLRYGVLSWEATEE